MKDNRLIAEFMGAFFDDNGMTRICGQYGLERVNDLSLKYHTSWDWLMPVLKKIKLQVHPDTVGMWRKVTQPIGYDIHEVHEEAVEFIKTYNDER